MIANTLPGNTLIRLASLCFTLHHLSYLASLGYSSLCSVGQLVSRQGSLTESRLFSYYFEANLRNETPTLVLYYGFVEWD